MKNVMLFGAGYIGKKALSILRLVDGVNVLGFIDNNKNLSNVEDIPVFSPEEAVLNKNCDIIISVINPISIAEQLKDLGCEDFYINYSSFLVKNDLLPKTVEALENSEFYKQFWYYSVELLPSLITRGAYAENRPMLPRMSLRNVNLKDMECLDLGSMECLIPALMAHGGAKRVLATDFANHCLDKINVLKHYHKVNFEYQNVGSMYDLDKKIKGSFDLINCSGLLYHTISPFTVLMGIRPLVKRNGLMIIATNVINEDEYRMEFNNAGRFQEELTTYWYMTVPLLDYMLRYLGLAPIDCLWFPHDETFNVETLGGSRWYSEKPSGYLSVVCRAVDEPVIADNDLWMANSKMFSLESKYLVDWERVSENPISTIEYNGNNNEKNMRENNISINLLQAIISQKPVSLTDSSEDTHTLKLKDNS